METRPGTGYYHRTFLSLGGPEPGFSRYKLLCLLLPPLIVCSESGRFSCPFRVNLGKSRGKRRRKINAEKAQKCLRLFSIRIYNIYKFFNSFRQSIQIAVLSRVG